MIDATGLLTGSKVLGERDSKYNGHLVVKRDLAWGTYIQADGLTQSGGVVEGIWKKTINKIPTFAKASAGKQRSKIKECLVLGLGGGTIAKLVRKKFPEVNITGVEIDPLMVEFGEKYLGLDTENVDVVIGDAKNYCSKIKSKSKNFDIVFIDLYCGDNFPKKFESEEFLKDIRSSLSGNGVAVFNRLYFGDKRGDAVRFGNKLESVFSAVEWVYPEANLMFVCKK